MGAGCVGVGVRVLSPFASREKARVYHALAAQGFDPLLRDGVVAVHRPRERARHAGGGVGVAAQVHGLKDAFGVAFRVEGAPKRRLEGVEDEAGGLDFVAGFRLGVFQEGKALVVGDVAVYGGWEVDSAKDVLHNADEHDARRGGDRVGVRDGRHLGDCGVGGVCEREGRDAHERPVAVGTLAALALALVERGCGGVAHVEHGSSAV